MDLYTTQAKYLHNKLRINLSMFPPFKDGQITLRIKTRMHTLMFLILHTVRLSYKVTSTRESLVRNLHTSCDYVQGYLPVEGLQGLKLVQDFNQ